LVASALDAAQRGDFAAAHRFAIASYLDGVEPHEAALRIDRPELLSRIEAAFAGLRQASDPGQSPSFAAVQRAAQAISALLSDAESGRKGKEAGSAAEAFLAALVIALREGLEVALLIAALLAFLRKSGQAALARSVHLGWMLSIPAGLLSFVLVGKLIDGAQRELAEGILTLVAAAILLSVTHFVLGAKEARHWLGFLRRRVEAAGQAHDERKQALWLVGIAFFAAFREALETALFYRALLLDAGPGGWRPVLSGIAVGLCALTLLVLFVGRIGRKLNPRPVMLISSGLLALLALVLTGHGIHSLQEAGYLAMTLVQLHGAAWTGLPSIGVYPTWQGLSGQAVMLALLLVPSLIEKLRTRPNPTGSLPQPTSA
jgi:high-affinity iron transporter